MSCEWDSKLDQYVDGELTEAQGALLRTHLQTCASCAASALGRMQMKRSVHAAAASAFIPSPELRARVTHVTASQRRTSSTWLPSFAFSAAAVLAVLAVAVLWLQRSHRQDVITEIADMHVATLASASPVDVISTDRHTVKPWFEGKLPFTFDLPELQNTEFHLIGGRMAYVGQSPGAQLLFGIRKHQISAFIFQDRESIARLSKDPGTAQRSNFNLETFSNHGLRYVVIGDASATDTRALSDLLRAASH